jgi:hypothetical protein
MVLLKKIGQIMYFIKIGPVFIGQFGNLMNRVWGTRLIGMIFGRDLTLKKKPGIAFESETLLQTTELYSRGGFKTGAER